LRALSPYNGDLNVITVIWIETDICAGDSERSQNFASAAEALRFEAFLDEENSGHWRNEDADDDETAA
jgi:hypothetical protein